MRRPCLSIRAGRLNKDYDKRVCVGNCILKKQKRGCLDLIKLESKTRRGYFFKLKGVETNLQSSESDSIKITASALVLVIVFLFSKVAR